LSAQNLPCICKCASHGGHSKYLSQTTHCITSDLQHSSETSEQ